MKKYLSVQEAADYLDIHPDTLRDWENKGWVKSIRTPGKHRRFKLDDLDSVSQSHSPSLSVIDRMMLMNQHLILKKNDSEYSDYHHERAEIFRRGYEALYEDTHVDPMTMSKQQCREVLNILSMFEDLKFSYEQLENKEAINKDDIKFEGFDEHGEYDGYEYHAYGYASFAEFYCSSGGGRFKHLAIERFGSFGPVLSRYRAMIGRYREVRKSVIQTYDRKPLTQEEIMFICGLSK